MAKKAAVKYVCTSCGEASSTWTGRCQTCGEWNTLQEEVDVSRLSPKSSGHKLKLESVIQAATSKMPRIKTGLADVDEVLGGGLVAGSVNLLAGQPGIGKSTLLLQIAYNAAKNHKVLFVSGEESARQVGMRAERLGTQHKALQLAVSSVANDVATTISTGDFEVVIVDSIQAVAVNELNSAPGTVSQITGSTQLLSAAAKSTNTALILVGLAAALN